VDAGISQHRGKRGTHLLGWLELRNFNSAQNGDDPVIRKILESIYMHIHILRINITVETGEKKTTHILRVWDTPYICIQA
jgi:hypothetical protein